jgi:cytoskeletal protein CcmA (bactofilin family)
VVAGSFDGELVAIQCIQLLATARVTGELHARELSAEEGCTVTGLCRTGSTPKPSA